MGMQVSSNLYLENRVRVKATRSVYKDSVTGVEHTQGEMTISGNTTVISLRYGATREQETAR